MDHKSVQRGRGRDGSTLSSFAVIIKHHLLLQQNVHSSDLVLFRDHGEPWMAQSKGVMSRMFGVVSRYLNQTLISTNSTLCYKYISYILSGFSGMYV